MFNGYLLYIDGYSLDFEHHFDQQNMKLMSQLEKFL